MGAEVGAEVAALEDAIARDPLAYLRPAAEVSALPAAAFVVLGCHGGVPVCASVQLPDALFAPEIAGLDLYARQVVPA